MIVAVSAEGPGPDARCSSIFGRCAYLSYVDAETLACESVPNEAAAASSGAGVQAAQSVVQRGASALISGDVGPNAVDVLSAGGVAVFTGAQGTVREAVRALREGRLTRVAGRTVASRTVADHTGIGASPAHAEREKELGRLRERAAALRRELADLVERIDTLTKGA